tara:strand:- start:253 stop:516 length:264 start_codon:yes stop_codon:yes gene_type:complete
MSNDEQVPGSENEADDVDADIEKFKRARKLKIGFGCIALGLVPLAMGIYLSSTGEDAFELIGIGLAAVGYGGVTLVVGEEAAGEPDV